MNQQADRLTPDSTAPGLLGWLPRSWRPYARLARLDRPIGTWLLLFPCWWGLALAGTGMWNVTELLWLAFVFAVGALVMRGAGCTINDILDRDFDAKVARTAQRPIPSGAVSVKRAWIFLAAELLVGLGVLLALHPFAWALGVASLAIVFTYPLMKRVTYWPQAVLGLAFNWGALMGYAAATGTLAWSAIALYAAGIFWTLGYDTIYAHQDKDDDTLIGVKSTALKFGAQTKPWLIGFYGATIALAALAGAAADLAWTFYALLALGGAQLMWQAFTVKIDDAADCLAKFRANRWFGWLLLAALIAGQSLRA
ncbi:MAG TPA: 4-hydroxybenzoate octaprenyltransferase [Alphaproteobacteria bacterium]|nr:4-hydroxybenzoate octaprenyltransferase [Alphaproteobacteria bacterium]